MTKQSFVKVTFNRNKLFHSDLHCSLLSGTPHGINTKPRFRSYTQRKNRLFSPCWGLLSPTLTALSVLDGLYLILTTRQRHPILFFLQHGFESPCWTEVCEDNTEMAVTGKDAWLKKDWAGVFPRPTRFSDWLEVCLIFAFTALSVLSTYVGLRIVRCVVPCNRCVGFFSQVNVEKEARFSYWNVLFNVRNWLTEQKVTGHGAVEIWLDLTARAKHANLLLKSAEITAEVSLFYWDCEL